MRDADHVVMERGFSLAFVGTQGQTRLIQFRLSKKGFSADRAADDAEFVRMLDEFCGHVERLLRERWGGIALRVAFDGEGDVIERLHAEGPSTVDARTLLIRASSGPVENWGVFERAPRLDDGAFAHEQRLVALAGRTA